MQDHGIITDFFAYNSDQSCLYASPDQTLARRQYRARYPVEIAALKCMDGRLNLGLFTQTPIGVIQPFRNLGGIFEVGGHFGELLIGWGRRAVDAGKDGIVLVTYHWSKGDPRRGCKGYECDVEAAKLGTAGLLKDIEDLFGRGHRVIYPIQVGIETDEDSLVIHGSGGRVMDLSGFPSDTNAKSVSDELEKLFPDMNQRMIQSLVPLCLGNIRHIEEIRHANRTLVQIDHNEVILGLGRGFDWHHKPNTMLIVGPYSFDLSDPVTTAGRILLQNLNSGRISKDNGVAIISSAVYRDPVGPEKEFAIKKALALARFGHEVLVRNVPDLKPYLTVAAGILDENTRLLTRLDVKLDQ